MKIQTVLLCIGLSVLCALPCSAEKKQKNVQATNANYECRVIETEMDGSYTLRACGKAKTKTDSYIQAGKEAVYNILFNTVLFSESGHNPLKPVVLEPNAREHHEDYFNKFFSDGGPYKKYVNYRDKVAGSSKWFTNGDQVTCITTVSVDRAGLKKRLQEDGIIK